MDWSPIIAGGMTGMLSGAVGSLIAPWVQWGIEKKRIKHQRRIKFIDECREILKEKPVDLTKVMNNPDIVLLRNYISPNDRKVANAEIDKLKQAIKALMEQKGEYEVEVFVERKYLEDYELHQAEVPPELDKINEVMREFRRKIDEAQREKDNYMLTFLLEELGKLEKRWNTR